MAEDVHSSAPRSRKPAIRSRPRDSNAASGPFVVAGGATHLVGQVAEARVAQPALVGVVHLSADLAQEAEEAIAGVAVAHGLQLVGQHRGDPHRDRRLGGLQPLQQGQVHRGGGLPQPLLAEGPGVEALDVRHVGVQDERELAHAGKGDGAGPSRRGTSTHATSTPTPITIATTGKLPRLATVLKTAWMAMQAKIEPVFS